MLADWCMTVRNSDSVQWYFFSLVIEFCWIIRPTDLVENCLESYTVGPNAFFVLRFLISFYHLKFFLLQHENWSLFCLGMLGRIIQIFY